MSSSPRSRAADIAAEQVEEIVAAAQIAGKRIEQDGRSQAERVWRQALAEADAIRTRAEADADRILAEGQAKVVRLAEEARVEAAKRIAGAAKEADRALYEARAISTDLRHLGESLSSQAGDMLRRAERIVEDAEAVHGRMSADLRLAAGLPPILPEQPPPWRADTGPAEQGGPGVPPRPPGPPPRPGTPVRATAPSGQAAPARPPSAARQAAPAAPPGKDGGGRGRRGRGSRERERPAPAAATNPLGDMEVPSWVATD